MRDIRPGALVVLGMDHPVMIDRIVDRGIPAVIINGMDRTMRLSCVLPDNWSAGWLAAQRLLAAGHREIVHVTIPHRLSLRRRLEGFRIALEEVLETECGRVVLRARVSGRGRGSGIEIDQLYTQVWTLANGKVTEIISRPA